VARTLNLNEALVAGAAANSEIRAEGVAALASACRGTAFGVPFFVAGRDRCWGQDRDERLLADGHGPAGAKSTVRMTDG
jgi:2-hydroxychromene-2-carboxylate isomerase